MLLNSIQTNLSVAENQLLNEREQANTLKISEPNKRASSHSRLKKGGLISGGLLLGVGVAFVASQVLWPSVSNPNQSVGSSSLPGRIILDRSVTPLADTVPPEFQIFSAKDYQPISENIKMSVVISSLFMGKLPSEYRELNGEMDRLGSFYQEKNITDIEPLVYTNENANRLRSFLVEKGVELTRKTSLWERWNGSPKEVDNGVFDQHLERAQTILGIFNKLIQDNAQEPSHATAINMHLDRLKNEDREIRKIAARRAVRMPKSGNLLDYHLKRHLISEGFVLPQTNSKTTANIGWGTGANGGFYWIQC